MTFIFVCLFFHIYDIHGRASKPLQATFWVLVHFVFFSNHYFSFSHFFCLLLFVFIDIFTSSVFLVQVNTPNPYNCWYEYSMMSENPVKGPALHQTWLIDTWPCRWLHRLATLTGWRQKLKVGCTEQSQGACQL